MNTLYIHTMFAQLDLKKIVIHTEANYRFMIRSKKDRKHVKKEILKIIHHHNIPETHYEYDRALGNAIHHGTYPVKCKVYIVKGSQMVCVITDAGQGFDYQEVIHKFNQHQVYYHNHGCGFRCYAKNRHLTVDWSRHGRRIMLHYK